MSHHIARMQVPTVTRRIAKSIAGAFYEESRSEEFRTAFPDQREYVQTQWPYFVRTAREVMADMLNQRTISDALKGPIYDALTNDFDLRTSTLPPLSALHPN